MPGVSQGSPVRGARMSDSLGARLRRRREERAISLATISEQTKIKLSLLEALEQDDVSRWPSGIFRRAYVRTYAHAIGLDPDVVVREFLAVHPEPAEVVEPLSAIVAASTGVPPDSAAPTRLRYIVDSAIESVARRRRRFAVQGPVLAGSGLGSAARSTDAGLQAASASAGQSPGPVAPPSPSTVAGVGKNGASSVPDLLAVASLCTELGRADSASGVQRLLGDAATLLDAVGLVVWVWDAPAAHLRPALVHGYSDSVRAQLPAVRRDSDNATAAAFRSSQACVVNGTADTSGALVVPLLTSAGCGGVLAVEMQHGSERAAWVLAVATIFAALLAQLIDVSPAG